MDVYDAIRQRRSIRRFKQKPISDDILKRLVDAGRIAPSAANLQPIEYILVNGAEICSKVFETIGWAGYIKPQWTPSLDERPTAYIVILIHKDTSFDPRRDVGLSAENIMLAAEAEGLGSCMLMNIKKEKIRIILEIPDNVQIDSLIAVGYKAEKSVMVDIKNSVQYYRDENQVLYVPKRQLEDIIHINKYKV